MPRLLLVDDNPSIHRIAESLLAPTDVELVCVDSAAAALDRIERGEAFDVILVDTAMPGMDGWTLLTRLREMKETAHLPIALMAGVLDPVDPAKLAKAPVQGFLKKPIELRELGDRVKALLTMPMTSVPEASAFSPDPSLTSGPSAFTTVPATPARDLVRMAETALPEFRPEFEMESIQDIPPMVEIQPPAAVPAPEHSDLEDDLLMLSAEDLWPEEAPAEPIEAAVSEPSVTTEVHLELEDLDLESLHDLASEPRPAESLPMVPGLPVAEAAAPVAEALGEESLMSFTGLDALDEFPGGIEAPVLPEPPPAETIRASMPPAAEAAVAAAAAAALVGITPAADPFFGGAHEVFSAPIVDELPVAPTPMSAADLSGSSWTMPEVEPQVDQVSALAPAVPGQVPAAAGQEPLTSGQIQALLADPVLVDALVKAVVARMGDQVIREIAWEVMPDLAGKLQK
ncbi:MAG TPA: response regulator [Geothrix sp.]|jgi:CheY-like chemotaxis protein